MQDSKALALAILNLVDFRYKAESIKNTSYRKLLDTYKYMLNDNLSKKIMRKEIDYEKNRITNNKNNLKKNI